MHFNFWKQNASGTDLWKQTTEYSLINGVNLLVNGQLNVGLSFLQPGC